MKLFLLLIAVLFCNSISSQAVKTVDTNTHCLLEGTTITMADRKDVPIEKIKPGQKVLVWNPVKKKMEKQTVAKIHAAQHPATEMISIYYQLKNWMKLSLTANHAVYSLTGWVSANPSATANHKRYATATVGILDSDAILYRVSEDGRSLMKKKIDSVSSYKITHHTILNTYTLELKGNGIFFANGFAVGQE